MTCCAIRPGEVTITRAACCKARCNARAACPATGAALVPLCLDGAAICPRGRWPDARGRVPWLGLRWVGLPAPLRPLLTWRLGRAPERLPGCGCSVALKWARLACVRHLRRFRR